MNEKEIKSSHSQSPQCCPVGSRAMSSLIWLAVSTGWAVSVFTVIEEMCMVSACRDTAGFSIFGLNMGWFGIAYFSLLLAVLWLRTRDLRFDRLLSVLVFSGVGAEFRLLWIQKYIIGGWCPLCVSICCALFVAAALLFIAKLQVVCAGRDTMKNLAGWLILMLIMSALGLAVAVVGVKALV